MTVALPAMVAPVQAQEVKTEVSKSFTDVSESHWAHDSIMKMRDAGIIHGYTDNTFKPNNAISRVHTASLFSRSLDLKPIRPGKEFKDVSETNVYYDAIQAVYRAGIFDGNTDGTFGVNDNLTRAQMAKVMAIAFDLDMHKGYIFEDVSKDHWAKDYIASLYMSGITVGSNGKHMPNQSVSRAHYVAFLDRALNPETAPKPEKPLQPDPPKVEVKPEPKQQPKPTPPDISNGVQKPAKLPEGAVVITGNGRAQSYSYQRNLPDEGKVNSVGVDMSSVSLYGIDKNGESFIIQYYHKTKNVRYLKSNPSFSNDSLLVVYEISQLFASAYGL